MNKKQKKIRLLCCVLGIVLCFMVLFVCLGGVAKVRNMLRNNKSPDSFTWEEYQSMSHEEQDELFQRFDSLEAFEEWKDSVQPKETEPDFSWNEPGKLPNEYTWEEYQTLTAVQKEAFYLWFESATAFETWKNQAEPEENTFPEPTWNDQQKQPDEYSWQEYQALTLEEQDAFFLWFDSTDDFEAWMNGVKPTEIAPDDLSWDIPGKKPKDYTWEEYQALTPEEQDAFYLWFDSMQAFEAWMELAKPNENETENAVWNKPGKHPDEYTWAEYQALTPEDQDLFYQWFPSREAFETWIDQSEKE